MEKKFNLTALKKELEENSKKELIKEILYLYKSFPMIKKYFNYKYDYQRETIKKKYKNIIFKEFLMGETFRKPKLRISVAKDAVTEYKKIATNPEDIIDIMLYYTEVISEFCTEFGVNSENFYITCENNFENTLKLILKENLKEKFDNRIENLFYNATDAMMHLNNLVEIYESVFQQKVTCVKL